MDGTTAIATSITTVSHETVLNAMREIELLPKLDQWVLIDPYGRMYRGTVEQVMPVLAAEHRMTKMPLHIGRIDGR